MKFKAFRSSAVKMGTLHEIQRGNGQTSQVLAGSRSHQVATTRFPASAGLDVDLACPCGFKTRDISSTYLSSCVTIQMLWGTSSCQAYARLIHSPRPGQSCCSQTLECSSRDSQPKWLHVQRIHHLEVHVRQARFLCQTPSSLGLKHIGSNSLMGHLFGGQRNAHHLCVREALGQDPR